MTPAAGRGHLASHPAAGRGRLLEAWALAAASLSVSSGCMAWAGHVCVRVLNNAAVPWTVEPLVLRCPPPTPCLPSLSSPQASEPDHTDPCLPWVRSSGPYRSEQGMASSCLSPSAPQSDSFCLAAAGGITRVEPANRIVSFQ